MKPIMYLGIDGPILVPHDDSDTVLEGVRVADYAKSFVHWAADNFHVVWLTDRPAHEAFIVADKLGLPKDKIPVLGFADNKTDGMPLKQPFVWVDGELIPGEMQWLGQHRKHDQFVQVDPLKGVTEEHKKALEKMLHTLKKGSL